ncbi:hypothetical protein C8R44DRAFT_747765 [Mycena epipterygia]|nr:hypothetical protein C8R44DRAFT_747765 [Mycena epipterygia]
MLRRGEGGKREGNEQDDEVVEEGDAKRYGTWSREGCGPSCDTMWCSANVTWKMGEDAASWGRDTAKNGEGDVEADAATTRSRCVRDPKRRGAGARRAAFCGSKSPVLALSGAPGIVASFASHLHRGRRKERRRRERHRAERSERVEEQGVSGVEEEGVTEVAEDGNASRGGRRERDCTEEGEEKRGRGIGVAQRSAARRRKGGAKSALENGAIPVEGGEG